MQTAHRDKMIPVRAIALSPPKRLLKSSSVILKTISASAIAISE